MEQSPEESALQFLERVYCKMLLVLQSEEKVILIGGNHLSIFPVYRYFYSAQSRILTLDAHCDCYDFPSLNHASFLNYLDDTANVKHVISGVRSTYGAPIISKQITIAHGHQQSSLDSLMDILPVDFLDIDVDVMDPNIFSWCGSPCEGGLTAEQVTHLVKYYNRTGGRVLAISEYIPNYDFQGKGLSIIKHIIDAFVGLPSIQENSKLL